MVNERFRQHSGVLTNIQRVQVEAESLHLAEQRRDQFRQTLALVAAEAVAYEGEVFLKLPRRPVGVLVFRRPASKSQARYQELEELAIQFGGGNQFPARIPFSEFLFIVANPLGNGISDADAACGHAQMAYQTRGFGDVVVDDDMTRHVEGFTGRVGSDEGIAVAVAADP